MTNKHFPKKKQKNQMVIEWMDWKDIKNLRSDLKFEGMIKC